MKINFEWHTYGHRIFSMSFVLIQYEAISILSDGESISKGKFITKYH